MVLSGFRCPKDNKDISFEQCLGKGNCASRCLSRSTLQLMSQVRKWKPGDKWSCTFLLNGTMYSYLVLKTAFYESPMDMSYRILGTKIHSALENMNDELSIIEEKFGEGENMTGMADCIEIEKGTNTLIDHKVTGHYKVMKALGVEKFEVDTGEFYKSGEKKGQPKVKQVRRLTDNKDWGDWLNQINRYRLFFEAKGVKVDRMKIEAIIRDFSFAPKIEGYELKPIEFMEIPKLPDEEVLTYFNRKIKALNTALANDRWNEPCDEHERWNDRRCSSYCPVWFVCDHGKKIKEEVENGSRKS